MALPSGKALGTQIREDIAKKAPLASPTFTGLVVVPTAESSDRSTIAASTAFVGSVVDEEKTAREKADSEEKAAREKVAEELAGLGFTVVDGALCQILEE